jgi:phosphoglycolate phosphatase
VFDVDGTLVDSRRSIADAMTQAFSALGLAPPSYNETRRIVGLSLEPAIQVLAPTLQREQWTALGDAYTQAFTRNREAGLEEPLYEGARAALESLKEGGWLLGIATGKSRKGVLSMLERHALGPLFDCAFCADDGPGKPDPHMLNLNMQTVNIEPHVTVMIGDTSFDMEMARAAKAYAIGVTWGFHTHDEIAPHAHEIAKDFDCLSERLSKWRELDVRDLGAQQQVQQQQ